MAAVEECMAHAHECVRLAGELCGRLGDEVDQAAW